MKKPFRVPILSIQNTLVNIDKDRRFLELFRFCKENINDELYFKFDFDLEARWYPVLITNDRWLPEKVLKQFPNLRK